MIRRTALFFSIIAILMGIDPHTVYALPPECAPKGPCLGAQHKTVRITLRNDTNIPMELMIEGKPVTIAPKASYALHATEGTQIYNAPDMTSRLLVTRDLKHATATFH